MISKHYEKPEINIVEFEVEDVLTSSAVVHTTAAPTTLPGSTSGGVQVGGMGDAQIDVNFSDFFK